MKRTPITLLVLLSALVMLLSACSVDEAEASLATAAMSSHTGAIPAVHMELKKVNANGVAVGRPICKIYNTPADTKPVVKNCPDGKYKEQLFDAKWKQVNERDVVVGSSSTPDPVEPPQPGPNPAGVSFDDIKAEGLDNALYPDEDHYVAEFLYQNPDVCLWEVDSADRQVTAQEVPTPPKGAVTLPAPSGGNDTVALERVINANEGGAVVGTGEYRVDKLDINVSVDIFNMPMKTTNGATEIVRVNSPDVRIFNSPIDAEDSSTAYIGFYVNHGAHRFVLINSGFSNIYHRNGNSAAGVYLRGVDDFHVACNTFDDIINDTSDNTKTARANAIWMNGAKRYDTSGGVIANNRSTNLQSNGKMDDAEFFTIQNYKSTDEARPTLIFANRGVNAGKRLTKHQEGNAKVLSNDYEWRDKQGPLGKRRLFAMVNIHFGDNVAARNNRLRVAADGRFDFIFLTNAKGKQFIQDNIHFDGNEIEVVDKLSPAGGSVSHIIAARNDALPDNSTSSEATNSSANYNVVKGSGSVRFHYSFDGGYRDDGGIFETKGNDIRIPYLNAEYK